MGFVFDLGLGYQACLVFHMQASVLPNLITCRAYVHSLHGQAIMEQTTLSAQVSIWSNLHGFDGGETLMVGPVTSTTW